MENVITMINNAVNVFQFQTDLLPLKYSNYCLSMEYTCTRIDTIFITLMKRICRSVFVTKTNHFTGIKMK